MILFYKLERMFGNYKEYKEKIQNLKYLIHKNIFSINNCVKNKAMLSFKYEYLNFWINFTQITIIIISGLLTLMESIKSYYNINDNIYEIINIFSSNFV